jgi:type II secretory pathway pseudopilin PulG
MQTRRAVRSAFTTVEIMAVIAIIAVLMALLLPAVQLMREASRKTTCLNNLKQIATAFQMHNNAWQYLPTAGGYDSTNTTNTPNNWNLARCETSSGVPVQTKQQDWGWAYQILPYIQKKEIYDSPAANFGSATNYQEWVVKAYTCPSRQRPPAQPNGQGCGLADGLRPGIDYAGNGGYRNKEQVNGRWIYRTANNEAVMYVFPDSNGYCRNYADGAVIPGKRPLPDGRMSANTNNVNNTANVQSELITLGSSGDLPDGASNTFLVGERRFNRSVDPAAGPDPTEDNGFVAGYTWDTIRWGYLPPAMDVLARPQVHPEFDTLRTQFGSPHSAIAHFAFCDGNIRGIAYTIDFKTYQAMCSRNGSANGADKNPYENPPTVP